MIAMIKRSVLLGAIAAAAIAGSAMAEQAAKLSTHETEKFSSCMAMKAEDMANDQACQAVMRKVDVTSADMVRMKACEWTKVDVDKDPNCVAMLKKHPELAQGHGRGTMDATDNKQ